MTSAGDKRPSPLAEALTAFAVATALTALLYQLGRFVPFVADNLQAFVAVVFIYLPVWMARRRGEDLSAHGFTTAPLGRSLAFGVGGPLLVFPLFLVGFVLYYGYACAIPALAPLTPPGMCPRFLGWSGLSHPHLAPGFLMQAFSQVVVVALPEELFFRGYLLGRLEQRFPPRLRVLGGGLGKALVLSALLFALGHVLVDLDPRRLAVFFPGLLFGWMRSATGSIFAGVVAHAGANLYIDALQRTFFG